MMADIPHEVKQGTHRYRMLHLEAGLLGQLLYLEATAIGKGATGVGAFYDDAANSIFTGSAKTLYHFAVGKPTEDNRVSISVSKMMKKASTILSSTQIIAGKCVCGKDAPHLCARCKGIKYCSQNCQKAHWPKHKSKCSPPPTSYSEVGELIRDFTPNKHTQLFKDGELNTTSLTTPKKDSYKKRPMVPYDKMPDKEYPNGFAKVLGGLIKYAPLNLFDPIQELYIPPQELFRCASLVPIPESTKETGSVPVEFFQYLLRNQPIDDDARVNSQLIFFKAQPIMSEIGVSLDPALRKPAPSNPTPKQLLYRYKKLYAALQHLTLASTIRIDGWEFYASRAEVFNQMHEYQLAWEDCMRCISLVKTGFTSAPPPNKFEYEVVIWAERLAQELEFKIGFASFQIVDSAEAFAELFLGTDHASEISSRESEWKLGIKGRSTAEFLEILDNIAGIRTDEHGRRIERGKFPQIMKNNYLNFTSHPTDSSDPRIAAWKNALQWLEEKYLCTPYKPLTVDFLQELNSKCGANDTLAFRYERDVWGVNSDRPTIGTIPPIVGFRMQNGNPRSLSSTEAAQIAVIEERLNSPERMEPGFKSRFTPEQRALLSEFYNELAPPERIPYELQKFVDLANSESFRKLHPVQRAAILGTRLVAIHPFSDSNGRTQQLLMGLELMREGYPPLVRREMTSYYKYLQHDIRGLEQDPNCEVKKNNKERKEGGRKKAINE
eukprot:Phypoly_transcript_00361.p1 GENE.Phypoly_transcript_00361~~Phypoly_transcript_00361.p1  ORF type:complete len:721 (+),score=117.83 Phypoly_transcript_00361:1704-3866(+)